LTNFHKIDIFQSEINRVAVRPDNYEALVDRLTSGVYLLAYALIVGALIVGFAFLIGRQELAQLPALFNQFFGNLTHSL
jgi:hypothetical protein